MTRLKMLRLSSVLHSHLLGVVLAIVLAACSSRPAPVQIGSTPTPGPSALLRPAVAPPDAATLAQKVLPVLRESLEGDDVSGYGFRDRSELATLTLGRPALAAWLPADAARTYRPGQRFASLLNFGPAPEWVVPVRAGTELRGLARVDESGNWLGFGGLPGGQPGRLALPPQFDDPAIPITFVEIPQIAVQIVLLEQDGQELLFLVNRTDFFSDLDTKAHQLTPSDEIVPALGRALDQQLGR